MRKAAIYILSGALALSACDKKHPEPEIGNNQATTQKTSLSVQTIQGVYTANSQTDSIDEHLVLKDGRDFYKIRNSGEGVAAEWCTIIDMEDHGKYDLVTDNLHFSKDGNMTYERTYSKSYLEADPVHNIVTSGSRVVRTEKIQGRWSQDGTTIDILLNK